MPLDPMSDVRNIIGFEIDEDGWLRERVVDLSSSPLGKDDGRTLVAKKTGPVLPKVPVRKRVYEELADSEDEDVDEYGWAERDDEDVVVDPLAVPGAGKGAGEEPAAETTS